MSDFYTTNTDPDRCASCDRLIGRAGRTDEELFDALADGTFATAIGVTDYSGSRPWPTTYFCAPCQRARL